MTWNRESDGSYSCTECGDAFPSGRSCSCRPAADSPSVHDEATNSTHPASWAGGESAGTLSLERCRRAFAKNLKALLRNSREALRVGKRAELGEIDSELAGIKNTSINASTNALKAAQSAIRAAAEMAAEAEKLEAKRELVAESRAQREADAGAVH